MALFIAAYFLCAFLGVFAFGPQGSPVTVWLPCGFYGAVLLLHKTRDWCRVVLAAGLAHLLLTLYFRVPVPESAGFFLANSAGALVGAWLMRRFVAEYPRLNSLKEFAGFVICLIFFGVTVRAGGDALILKWMEKDSSWLVSWRVWWCAASITTLIASPLVLIWRNRPALLRLRDYPPAKAVEFLMLLAGMLAGAWYVLVLGDGIAGHAAGWLPFFVIWAGLRFGTRGASLVIVLLSVLMASLTSHYLTGLTPEQISSGAQIFFLQTQLSLWAIGGMALAIVLEQRDFQMAQLREREQSVRETQERFLVFMDQTPGLAFIKDEKGRFVFVNAAWAKFFDRPLGSVIGQTSFDVWPAAIAASLVAGDRVVFSSDCPVETIESMPNRDGTSQDWMVAKFPLKDTRGNRLLGGFCFNITKTREAERAREALQLRYQRLYESLFDGFAATDLKGHFIESNQAMQEMLQFSAAEFKELSYQQITPAEWLPVEADILATQVMTRGYSNVFEKEYYRRDGGLVPVEVRIHLETNAAGEPVGFRGIIRDVSERVRAFRALERSERRLSLAVSATSDAIWEWNIATREAYFSPRWYEMLGYVDREFPMTAETFHKLCHPEDLARVIASFTADPNPSITHVSGCEFRLRARDGSWRWILARGKCVDHIKTGKPTCLSGTIMDITGRKLAELRAEAAARERDALEAKLRQAQKMEAIGTLAGGIAHDFNNVLGAIIAYTELARMDSAENPLVKKSLAQVLKACRRARDLVVQILSFSRQNKVERRIIPLQSVIKDGLKLLTSTLPSTIEIVEKINPEAGPVLADATQIHQVLVNLCTNAAHAIAGHCGRLEVSLDQVLVDEVLGRSTTPDLPVGDYVMLSVSDTGHGMDAETLTHIFEPFFTTKKPGQGTGLGLAVVHGIVRGHEGAVRVSSQPGIGTQIQVFFPTRSRAELNLKVSSDLLEPGKGERVLLVDDEPALCEATATLLGKFDYQVISSTKPVEALEMFRRQPDAFDLVLLDLTMPRLSGLELAASMLEQRPGLPILLISGFSGSLTSEIVRQRGISGLIMKPIVPTALLQAIRAALPKVTLPN
jgi:PAS domain S-box-containing protein